MHNDDLLRELDKIGTALHHAGEYLAKMNESNAMLHLSERVLYSPLTVEVLHAKESVELILAQLTPEAA